MKKESQVILIVSAIIVVVILLVVTGVIIIKNNSKASNKDNNQIITENKQPEEIINEKEEKNYEIIDQSQMLNWNTIKVKGKGLQDAGDSYDDPLVNNFSTDINLKASVVMKQYPNSVYENQVYFSKLNQSGYASGLTNVKMCYDKQKDIISSLYFNVYTAEEFYINDIQLVDLKLSEVKEKLGQPYAVVDDYYVYRYNDGYILINFMINTRYIRIVKKEYTSDLEFLNEFLNDINN